MRGIAAATVLAALTGSWALIPSDSRAVGPDPSQKTASICRKGPLRKPRADCAPPALPSTGNPYEDCVRRINQLRRACQCLPPLTRWKGGEKCANMHAKHDSRRGIHAGFNAHICKPQGFAQNECPAWPSTERVVEGCLQAMWDEGPGKRFSKHGHYMNMSKAAYEQVACGFARGSNGKIWSVQNFR
ncbi:MAG: CAP domain-containing protein [Myxococcales bacterium]|nr:CAP domain-containing protein [Myxococcales bacterium]MDH3482909.1 CAP domain-containing protein [Myxococcales bacterium]